MLNSFAKKSKKIQWHLKAVLEEQDLSAKIDKAQQWGWEKCRRMASPSSWIRGFSRIVAGYVAERCLFFGSMLLQFTSLPTVGSLRTLGCICLSGQMGGHVAWTEGTHNWQIQSLAILVSLWSFQVTCFVRTGFLSPMKVTQLLQRDLSMVKLQSEVKSWDCQDNPKLEMATRAGLSWSLQGRGISVSAGWACSCALQSCRQIPKILPQVCSVAERLFILSPHSRQSWGESDERTKAEDPDGQIQTALFCHCSYFL